MSVSLASPPSAIWNPTYPRRTHTSDAPRLDAVLAEWKRRASTAIESLSARKDAPSHRLRVQLQGALDQLTDCVRRLPGEAAGLYHEDEHRLSQAISALERLVGRV